MTKHCVLLLFMSLSVLFSGCGKPGDSKDNFKTKEVIVPVTVREVLPLDFAEFGIYYGKTSGIKEATLISMSGGRVEEIKVKEGQRVQAGQSLASIQGNRAVTGYDLAVLNEKVARENHARQQKHLEEGNASQLAVDQAHLAFLNSKSARLAAQKVKEGALCISPLAGRVVSRHITLHQELSPGSPTFTVAQLNRVKIRIGIPENDMTGLKTGNRAEVTLSMLPDRVWKGSLTSLARQMENRTRTFPAEITIDNADGRVLSGITARVKLLRRNMRNRLVVPTIAIRTEGDQSFVMIAEAGKGKKVIITTGPGNNTHTVITSGLQRGMNLIVENQHMVADGTPLKIIDK